MYQSIRVVPSLPKPLLGAGSEQKRERSSGKNLGAIEGAVRIAPARLSERRASGWPGSIFHRPRANERGASGGSDTGGMGKERYRAVERADNMGRRSERGAIDWEA